jgi:ubiquinone/menaquinone biosynthesis C-methylase UbiE
MADTDFDPELTTKMQRDWDERARENARFYVHSGAQEWSDEAFFDSGQRNVAREILTDMGNICQGRNPKRMKVLEIGCGVGRVTRALADLFGKVYGVDVSGEMIRQAKTALAGQRNVRLFQNNGKDLAVVGNVKFDFAFSYIVFQHIPSHAVIESYVREVYRLLRPGGLFKFQVQGGTAVETVPGDTWVGVPFSEQDAIEMAARCGFEPRYRHGAGTQYFWLWFFKPRRRFADSARALFRRLLGGFRWTARRPAQS